RPGRALDGGARLRRERARGRRRAGEADLRPAGAQELVCGQRDDERAAVAGDAGEVGGASPARRGHPVAAPDGPRHRGPCPFPAPERRDLDEGEMRLARAGGRRRADVDPAPLEPIVSRSTTSAAATPRSSLAGASTWTHGPRVQASPPV